MAEQEEADIQSIAAAISFCPAASQQRAQCGVCTFHQYQQLASLRLAFEKALSPSVALIKKLESGQKSKLIPRLFARTAFQASKVDQTDCLRCVKCAGE